MSTPGVRLQVMHEDVASLAGCHAMRYAIHEAFVRLAGKRVV